jgi:hypothetical protein
VPAEPEGGVPEITPAALREMPEDGLQPENAVLENVAAGVPVAVTVKLPAVPTVKLVELALVITGAWSTVRVKLCVPGPTELVALMQAVKVPPVVGVPDRTPEELRVMLAGNVEPQPLYPFENVGAG